MMKLDNDIKCSIQYFVYFMFKGTMDSRLIFAEYDYVDKLTLNPLILSNCFLVYADAMSKTNRSLLHKNKEQDYLKLGSSAELAVAEYIISLETNDLTLGVPNINELSSFWKDFFDVAQDFCLNPYDEKFLSELNGFGTDAVPFFSVWTNVVELDEKMNVTNAKYALQRARERVSWMHGIQPKTPFEEWEIDQEIW